MDIIISPSLSSIWKTNTSKILNTTAMMNSIIYVDFENKIVLTEDEYDAWMNEPCDPIEYETIYTTDDIPF